MDATDTPITVETTRLNEVEAARADARGMAFLVGMVVTGALAIVATLTFGGPPVAGGAAGAQISAH
jgi:hypothetical protein